MGNNLREPEEVLLLLRDLQLPSGVEFEVSLAKRVPFLLEIIPVSLHPSDWTFKSFASSQVAKCRSLGFGVLGFGFMGFGFRILGSGV